MTKRQYSEGEARQDASMMIVCVMSAGRVHVDYLFEVMRRRPETGPFRLATEARQNEWDSHTITPRRRVSSSFFLDK